MTVPQHEIRVVDKPKKAQGVVVDVFAEWEYIAFAPDVYNNNKIK